VVVGKGRGRADWKANEEYRERMPSFVDFGKVRVK